MFLVAGRWNAELASLMLGQRRLHTKNTCTTILHMGRCHIAPHSYNARSWGYLNVVPLSFLTEVNLCLSPSPISPSQRKRRMTMSTMGPW